MNVLCWSQSCFVPLDCGSSASPRFQYILQFSSSRGSSVALFGGSPWPALEWVGISPEQCWSGSKISVCQEFCFARMSWKQDSASFALLHFSKAQVLQMWKCTCYEQIVIRCLCGQARQTPSRRLECILGLVQLLRLSWASTQCPAGLCPVWSWKPARRRFLCLSGLCILMLKYSRSEIFFLVVPHCGSLSTGALCPVAIVPCAPALHLSEGAASSHIL